MKSVLINFRFFKSIPSEIVKVTFSDFDLQHLVIRVTTLYLNILDGINRIKL